MSRSGSVGPRHGFDNFGGFSARYARARAIQYDRWADEILTIADDASGDLIQRLGKDGSTERVVDHENIQRSRLRCDSRKWLLSKLLPSCGLLSSMSTSRNCEGMSLEAVVATDRILKPHHLQWL
jgi:hypothetical protein